MTEIGKLIRHEAIQEGEGKGKDNILIKLLIKKFKSIPNEYIEKIKKLPNETIVVIATDIFDIEKVKEFEKYF